MKNKISQITLTSLAVLVIISQFGLESSATPTTRWRHHLKWVAKEPVLPIFIEKLIGSPSAEYRWFKHPQNVYIEDLISQGRSTSFLESHSLDRTILYILEYNVSTHENLGSYEPKLISTDGDDGESSASDPSLVADIYHLAFVDAHSIGVTETRDDLIAHCNVSILLPNNYKNETLKLVERGLGLKLGFASGRTNSLNHLHHHHYQKQHAGNNKQNKVGFRI